MYKLIPILERWLKKIPGFWRKLEANIPLPEVDTREMQDHVVIIGYGRVGRHLVDVLLELEVPILVIESDVERISALNQRQVVSLYGDAANSEVITHAGVEHARALVVTLPDETATMLVVASARDLNPQIPIVVRAASEDGVLNLARVGANRVVHPELEGGLEMVHHTLLQLGFPLRQVHEYAESVRRDRYDIQIDSADEHRSLHELMIAADSIEITWIRLEETSPLLGRTLQDANLRRLTGASVVALIRHGQLIPNPKSLMAFEAGDQVGFIGEPEQVAQAVLLAKPLAAESADPDGEPVENPGD